MKVIQGKKYRCLCEVRYFTVYKAGTIVEVEKISREPVSSFKVSVKAYPPIPLDIFMACFEPCEE